MGFSVTRVQLSESSVARWQSCMVVQFYGGSVAREVELNEGSVKWGGVTRVQLCESSIARC